MPLRRPIVGEHAAPSQNALHAGNEVRFVETAHSGRGPPPSPFDRRGAGARLPRRMGCSLRSQSRGDELGASLLLTPACVVALPWGPMGSQVGQDDPAASAGGHDLPSSSQEGELPGPSEGKIEAPVLAGTPLSPTALSVEG